MAIRRGEFTGRCLAHRLLFGPRLGPYQAAIGVDYTNVRMMLTRGDREVMAHVRAVCIKCGTERWRVPSVIQGMLRRGTYTGLCRPCSAARNGQEGTEGRNINSNGYVVITAKRGLPPELHAAYDMVAANSRRKVAPYVMEHTVVMAARLGRALHKYETVHHRNGKKADNRPSNLRLYKTGEHHPGYGDFYQEWQEALSEIARLKAMPHEQLP